MTSADMWSSTTECAKVPVSVGKKKKQWGGVVSLANREKESEKKRRKERKGKEMKGKEQMKCTYFFCFAVLEIFACPLSFLLIFLTLLLLTIHLSLLLRAILQMIPVHPHHFARAGSGPCRSKKNNSSTNVSISTSYNERGRSN